MSTETTRNCDDEANCEKMEDSKKPDRTLLDRYDKNFGAHLRDMILTQGIQEPIRFRSVHKDWDPCTWSLSDWGELFKSQKLSVRYGRQQWDSLQPQWESDCGKIDLTWKEMVDWLKGEFTFKAEVTAHNSWVYYDYKYLPDVFHMKSSDEKDFLKLICSIENLKKKFSWSKLGFPDRNGDHSTLWVGTLGSYTPCHFDTYSCNLICQVYGRLKISWDNVYRKTWLLFPPEDTEYLHPTRVPYEESSVYSRINFASSKGMRPYSEDLGKCKPRKITLEPGDCLFVPAKWWHFVRSDDFSISINTWIELQDDHLTRIEEAVLRSIVSAVANTSFPETTEKILNPNEMDITEFTEVDINDLLKSAATAFSQSQMKSKDSMYEHQDSATSDLNDIEVKFSKETAGSGTTTSCVLEKSIGPSPKRMKTCHISWSLEELITKCPLVEKLTTISPSILFPPEDDSDTATGDGESSVDSAHQVVDTSDSSVKLAKNNEGSKVPSYIYHLLNAIGHPEVLKQISSQFFKNVTSSSSNT